MPDAPEAAGGQEIRPADIAGIQTVDRAPPDGRAYAHCRFQRLSELYVAEGWR